MKGICKRPSNIKKIVFSLSVALSMLMIICFGASDSWGTDFPFTDDVENPSANNWSAVVPWARTTAQYHSGTTSWTDSPSGSYANSADNALTLATAIDLSGTTAPQLSFWYKHQLEEGYDYLYLEYSADNGTTWTTLKSYTGNQGTWRREQVSLPKQSIKIRFHLVTDSVITKDGFYADDIVIGEKPAAVTLGSPSGATSSSLVLTWGARASRTLPPTGYTAATLRDFPTRKVAWWRR